MSLKSEQAQLDEILAQGGKRSLLNVFAPTSVPKHYRISEQMVEDFVHDPVMGAELLFGEKLDVFQRVRLKLYWHVPRVMDSSGFSSAKTHCMWVVSNLRALLISDHISAVYYQDFGAGQRNYWNPNYRRVSRNSTIFRAHIGRMEADNSRQKGKAERMGPSCWTCDYKNGSKVMMPAAGFLQDAKSQAGLRINDLFIDEWTKIAATSEGIEKQLIGRATRACFNKEHPFWKNHQIFLATAEDSSHPAWEKYQSFLEEANAANPDYALINFSFKDYSDLPFKDSGRSFKEIYREDSVINDIRKAQTAAGFRQEALGFWSRMGRTLYSGDSLEAAYKAGASTVRPIGSRSEDWAPEKEKVYFFLGSDPAKADNKKADDGALVALRAEPKPEIPHPKEPTDFNLDWVWAYKVRKADGPQWSAIMHRKDIAFNFARICMDPGGGGNWIRPELKKPKQMIQGVERNVIPIACIEDEAEMPVFGKMALSMFKIADERIQSLWGHHQIQGGDKLYDIAHTEFITAWMNGYFRMPPKARDVPRDEIAKWSEEKRWSNLLIQEMGKQLTRIVVKTMPDGKTFYTKNNAREFSSKGHKDFAYAAMFAYCAFLSWLKDAEMDVESNPEDRDLCG